MSVSFCTNVWPYLGKKKEKKEKKKDKAKQGTSATQGDTDDGDGGGSPAVEVVGTTAGGGAWCRPSTVCFFASRC